MEFKTLYILKIKPQQRGSLKVWDTQQKLEMAVVTGLRPLGEKGGDQGRTQDRGRTDLGGQYPHADYLLSPCFPRTPLHPAFFSLHI